MLTDKVLEYIVTCADLCLKTEFIYLALSHDLK